MAGTNVTVTCTVLADDSVSCNGTLYVLPEETLTYTSTWFWVYIGIYVGLVLFAGLMSGLTLGMLSLDMMTLKVLQQAGTATQKKHASRILPVVKRHHLLLVTLLLANALAVESMPLCLDRVSDPITAIVVSVTAVLLFGEVFPQALCSRYGLAIGATMVPVVYLLIMLFFIIAWPLSKLLDCLLGKEHSTFFRRAELKALVSLHGPEDDPASVVATEDGPLSLDEVLIIKGALEMRDKTVRDAMVPLESVFMLDVNARMDKATMSTILSSAHSRVPVYETRRDNILGVLLVKTLILLDPSDGVPIANLIHNPACSKQLTSVDESTPLYDLLNEFQTGKSHLSFVYRSDPSENVKEENEVGRDQDIAPKPTDLPQRPKEMVGIITLEDVIEELLQEEIIDETDVYVDVHNRVRVARARARMLRSVSAPSTPGLTPAATPRAQRRRLRVDRGKSNLLKVPPGGQHGKDRPPDTSVAGNDEISDNPSTPLLQSQTTVS